jgi:hypothetical protein
MRPGDKFVELFSHIENILSKRVASRKRIPFHELVDAASAKDATTRHWRGFLKDVGDLRNAIVHRAHYPREIVADPRPEFIRQLKKVFELIKSPQKIIPRFQRKIRLFAAQDQLGAALAYMQQNDYSQVVVQISSEFRILSSEGIVRWLSDAREVGLADLGGAVVQDAYRHEGATEQRYMARDETVDAALSAFEHAIEEGIPRLHAILITHSGKPTEGPLGIITPWDLLGLGGNDDGS